MESKKLEALLMAVDLGSFTKAAEVLGYTQSGLTHMMNSLEKEVGFTLLERGRSGVRLTEEGERIAPAVREFLQANARLDSVIEQVASSRTEIIRVSAYASIAMHWLPELIEQFRRRYSGVSCCESDVPQLPEDPAHSAEIQSLIRAYSRITNREAARALVALSEKMAPLAACIDKNTDMA